MIDNKADRKNVPIRAGRRDPVHPSITREQISELVERFYEYVRKDERLGAIFNERINATSDGDWQPHLAKMKKFWASVLLKTGEYKGQPVVVHNALPDLEETDFKIWLNLFAKTVDEIMETAAASPVNEAAKRIAQSLYLARFGSAQTTLPF